MRLGEHDLRTHDEAAHEDLGVKEIIIHEDFDTTSFANDIAIIVLDRKVEFRSKFFLEECNMTLSQTKNCV